MLLHLLDSFYASHLQLASILEEDNHVTCITAFIRWHEAPGQMTVQILAVSVRIKPLFIVLNLSQLSQCNHGHPFVEAACRMQAEIRTG